MVVDAERDHRRRVAEPRGDDVNRNALGEQMRRVRVPDVVEASRPDARPLAKHPESLERGEAGILLVTTRPSAEPSLEMSDEELRGLLGEVYAGAPWVDLGRLLLEVRDPAAPWSETLRFFFNMPAAGTLALVDPVRWDGLRVERVLVAGETVALGFDGSDTRDATALVAITEDGCLVPIELIERPVGADDEWRVDRARIHSSVERAFTDYRVLALYGDPWGWRSELSGWADRWPGRVLEVPMNSPTRAAELVDRFRSAVAEASVHHNGNPDLRRHVMNARLRKVGRDETGLGRFAVAKAGPGRLVDACAASLLALEAHAQAPAAPEIFAGAW